MFTTEVINTTMQQMSDVSKNITIYINFHIFYFIIVVFGVQ